jgi:hypothetical protein
MYPATSDLPKCDHQDFTTGEEQAHYLRLEANRVEARGFRRYAAFLREDATELEGGYVDYDTEVEWSEEEDCMEDETCEEDEWSEEEDFMEVET